MASTITRTNVRRRIALKGQSRSRFCGEPVRKGGKVPCLRLAGHNGKHRPTTFRNAPKETTTTAPVVAEAPANADGTIGETVTVVPEQEPKARLDVSGVVGQQRTARRGKGAHRSGKPSARLA
jgi:hypothetical protein